MLGVVWQAMAGPGMAWHSSVGRRGLVRVGMAGLGSAKQADARQGKA